MSEPLLQGRTLTEKIWHASEIPLGIIILTLCWETTPTWLRVVFTVLAAVGILLVLGSAWLDVAMARLQRKVAARGPDGEATT